jgi:hypothetical protein
LSDFSRALLAGAAAGACVALGWACSDDAQHASEAESTTSKLDASEPLDEASTEVDSHVIHEGHDAGDADAPHTEHDGGHLDCTNIGVTGTSPNCRLTATCTHGMFAIDCTVGDGTCSCPSPEGGMTSVSTNPLFCGVLPDGGSTYATILDDALAAAHGACGWL